MKLIILISLLATSLLAKDKITKIKLNDGRIINILKEVRKIDLVTNQGINQIELNTGEIIYNTEISSLIWNRNSQTNFDFNNTRELNLENLNLDTAILRISGGDGSGGG